MAMATLKLARAESCVDQYPHHLPATLWSSRTLDVPRYSMTRAIFSLAGLTLILGCSANHLASTSPRTVAWRQDLELAVSEFLAKDRSFSPEERSQFRREIENLRHSVDRRSDEQIIVGLARAIALSGNAYTRAYILRNRGYLRRYPIRVWWFRDGLFVVKAKPEHRDLLGLEIKSIARRNVSRLAKTVEPLFAGNDSWDRYMSTYSLTSPDVLLGLDLIEGDGAAEFVFHDKTGRAMKRVIEPLPLERLDRPTEAWWDLSPLHPGNQSPWESVLPRDAQQLPLYLQNPTKNYWFIHLPNQKALYFQFNRASPMPDESVEAFSKRLLDAVAELQPEKLIVDIRFNTGGNLQLGSALFEHLATLPLAQDRARFFVIVGRNTFSAGITHVAQLKQLSQPTFVGEAVGDVLDFWSEGGNVVLPNSKLILHYADRFHAYSTIDYPNLKQYFYLDLNVESVDPDIWIEQSSVDYLTLRDPALETILMRSN
jgi:hypothetical protein